MIKRSRETQGPASSTLASKEHLETATEFKGCRPKMRTKVESWSLGPVGVP